MNIKSTTTPKNTIADSLAEQIAQGNSSTSAELGQRLGLPAEEMSAWVARAIELFKKGPDPREVIKLPAIFQTALIKLAEREGQTEIVVDLLAISKDKEVKKEARRILHKLRSRGISIDIPKETGPSVLERKVFEEPELPCYLSPPDGAGNRTLILARYTHGGVEVFHIEMNDKNGLVQFKGGKLGRHQYREAIHGMLEESPGRMILEISFSEARYHLARAVQLSREQKRPLPDGYLEASATLGELKETDAAPDPVVLFPAEASVGQDALVKAGAELIDLPEFADWFPEEVVLQKLQTQLSEVATSQVAINEQQKIEQVQRVIDNAPAAVLEGEKERITYQRRLLEMAVCFQRKERAEQAKQIAAVAWQLTQEGFQPNESPFFIRMTKKIFHDPAEIVRTFGSQKDTVTPPATDPGNLIVPP
jgi:hypothetical protein